jgi:hypothetical protein
VLLDDRFFDTDDKQDFGIPSKIDGASIGTFDPPFTILNDDSAGQCLQHILFDSVKVKSAFGSDFIHRCLSLKSDGNRKTVTDSFVVE